MYPSVGEYILTNIVDMYSPSGSDEIHMKVDIPENDGIWVFDYPYSWDINVSESPPQIADELGYNRNNFHEMVGEPVLVKPDDNDELCILIINRAEDRIRELYEDGDVDIRDIDAENIDQNFNINYPTQFIE